MIGRFFKIAALLLLISLPCLANADPVKVSSPDLRQIQVKQNRAMGRLYIQANFSSHHIVVDGAEYPAYLADYGIEVTSNELHEVKVSNGTAEKTYKFSVNPNESMVLYVDLGAGDNKPKEKPEEKKKDDGSIGYLTVTAESEAQIYIDGKLIQAKTPLKKHEVTPGSHTVRVYFLNTRKFSKSREIYVGKDASMSLNFAKE